MPRHDRDLGASVLRIAVGALFVGLVACTSGSPRRAADPNTSSPAPSPSVSDVCERVTNAALARHAVDRTALRRYEAQVAAQDAWQAAVRALLPALQDAALTDAAGVVAAAPTTVTDAPEDPAVVRALGALNRWAQARCGYGVSSFRLDRFRGVRLPDGSPPAYAVVGTGREVAAVDVRTGRTLAVVAEPVATGGGVYDVALSADGGTVWFLEELGAFAQPSATAIWRVALAGGDFDLVALEHGLIETFDVSPDGEWVAYAYSAPDADGGLVVLGEDGTEARADRTGGVWLADSRRLAVPVARGVEVLTVDDLRSGSAGRFLVAGTPVGVRPGDGALVVTSTDGTQRYVDPDTGRVVGRPAYGRGRYVVDFDATGRHPLVAGEAATQCDHVCPSDLYRVDGSRLVLIRPGVIGAAWS